MEEVKKEEIQVQEQPKDDFKLNFERLSKQEKFNQETRKQIEEKKKEFEKDKEELEKYRQFDKELQRNPISMLEKIGLSPQRINQLIAERQNPVSPEVREALETARRLEAELKSRDEKEKQSKLEKEEIRLVASIDEEVKKGEYDLIDHFGASSAVKAFMEQYYEETGEIPDIKMACEAVTQNIAEKVSKAKDSKWLKPKEVESVKKEVHTISNKMTQAATPKIDRALNETERFNLAVEMLKTSRRK